MKLRLHEREGREHRRREADEPERRHAALPVQRELRRRRLLARRRPVRTTRATSTPGTYSVSETVPQGWDLASAVCDDQSQPELDRARGRRDGDLRLHEREGREDHRREADASERRSAGLPLRRELRRGRVQRSRTGSRTTRATSLRAPTRSPRTCRQGGRSRRPSARTSRTRASISLAAGEVVRCVFTNTKRGTIIVEKQTLPDGTPGTFAFSGDAAGSIGDNGQIVVSNLLPGTYTSTEAVDGRLDPDLDRVQRRELDRCSRHPDGDVHARGRRDREVHLHEPQAGACRPGCDRRPEVGRSHHDRGAGRPGHLLGDGHERLEREGRDRERRTTTCSATWTTTAATAASTSRSTSAPARRSTAPSAAGHRPGRHGARQHGQGRGP